MIIYSGMPPGTFYELHSKEMPNTYVMSCIDLEYDVHFDVTTAKRYRSHNRLVSNVEAHEVRSHLPDVGVIAYLFTPGIGEVVVEPWSLTVIRRSAYNDLIASQSDPVSRRPNDRRSALKLVLNNQQYLVYEATNVATLIVPTQYPDALDKAISNAS